MVLRQKTNSIAELSEALPPLALRRPPKPINTPLPHMKAPAATTRTPAPPSSNIPVSCRLRPSPSSSTTSGCITVDGDSVTLRNAKDTPAFCFDHVLGTDASQEDCFNATSLSLAADVLKGYNATIFAYGQTGSGKTHTMMGADDGIIPRSVAALFAAFESAPPGVEFTVRVSMLEIYQETIRDLLNSLHRCTLRDAGGEGGGVRVEGACELYVSTVDEALSIIARGTSHRAIKATKMNDESSRSHSVIMFTLTQNIASTGVRVISKLSMVDLAGSEQVKKTEAAGQVLQEAKMINKSLSALGNVINALTSGRPHVPFRDSKLTRLLQDSLGGNAVTRVIVTVSVEDVNARETASTLRFGVRSKRIKNVAKVRTKYTVSRPPRASTHRGVSPYLHRTRRCVVPHYIAPTTVPAPIRVHWGSQWASQGLQPLSGAQAASPSQVCCSRAATALPILRRCSRAVPHDALPSHGPRTCAVSCVVFTCTRAAPRPPPPLDQRGSPSSLHSNVSRITLFHLNAPKSPLPTQINTERSAAELKVLLTRAETCMSRQRDYILLLETAMENAPPQGMLPGPQQGAQTELTDITESTEGKGSDVATGNASVLESAASFSNTSASPPPPASPAAPSLHVELRQALDKAVEAEAAAEAAVIMRDELEESLADKVEELEIALADAQTAKEVGGRVKTALTKANIELDRAKALVADRDIALARAKDETADALEDKANQQIREEDLRLMQEKYLATRLELHNATEGGHARGTSADAARCERVEIALRKSDARLRDRQSQIDALEAAVHQFQVRGMSRRKKDG